MLSSWFLVLVALILMGVSRWHGLTLTNLVQFALIDKLYVSSLATAVCPCFCLLV